MIVLLVICFELANSLSIGTVHQQNVTKREANFYPDWVPFKNKHGDELGEFVQVTKPKPKKRLAPPINFILRAVAEPDGDDYYDKGQGDTESDDYFEKKEWSDLNRAPIVPSSKTTPNHTDISDIDGVVSIITNHKPNPIIEALKNIDKQKIENSSEDLEEKDENEEKIEKAEKAEKVVEKSQTKNDTKVVKKPHRYEDDIEYEDGTSDKRKSDPVDDEQSENEAKKAKILESVDLLKARHAEEQRAISEKVKEEEIYKEEHERDKIQLEDVPDKYDDRPYQKKKVKLLDYDDYEDKSSSSEEIYRPLITTTRKPRTTTKRKNMKDINVKSGKLSVFKNPRAYMVFDDEEEVTTTMKPKRSTKRPNKTERYSSKYSASQPDSEENVRISLVPENTEGKSDEPALFFPKKRKNKRRRKTTTTSPPDSHVAETVTENSANLTADTTASDTTLAGTTAVDTGPSAADTGPSAADTTPSAANTAPSAADTAQSAANTAPSAVDAESTQVDDVTDTVPSSTHQKKKETGDYHVEKGGGSDHHSEHEEAHEESGKKAYEGVHKNSKTSKGHHDKEDHLDKYDDHGHEEENKHDEKSHFGAHHHEEHGKKHAKYEESGKHSKGHSTKGSHDIHKKEEYEKKVEFFEEDGDSGEEEKHGGFNHEKEHALGGNFKNGKHKAGHEEHAKGESGHFGKGGHYTSHKGHRNSAGHDSHGKRGHQHHHDEGKESGKKWIYHHGFPAKNANLVVIDRRADKYYHGPQYYG